MSIPDIKDIQNYADGTYNVAFDARSDAQDGTYSVTKKGDSYTISKDGLIVDSGNINKLSLFFADGSIESISTPKTPVTSPGSKIITDDDIRGLIKLLLQAFTSMINAQRQGDLNDLNGVLNALTTKLDAMGKSADAAYDAAMAQAITNIVSGCINIGAGTAKAVCAGKAHTESKDNSNFDSKGSTGAGDADTTVPEAATNVSKGTDTVPTNWGMWGNIVDAVGGSTKMVEGVSGIFTAGYTAEQQAAEIEKERANAQLEFWKQGESMDEKSIESFFNFLKTILSVLQEYKQNAASTEQSIARMS
ncbi:MAG: hypothetical protein LBE99_02715 [Puniceicoccales bacterium]|jgi:hypothetical protein|nr:hypothetical protein [Puniceicoccales bacterium]